MRSRVRTRDNNESFTERCKSPHGHFTGVGAATSGAHGNYLLLLAATVSDQRGLGVGGVDGVNHHLSMWRNNVREVFRLGKVIDNLNIDIWIYLPQPLCQYLGFGLANGVCQGMNLAVAVGDADIVQVD